MELLTNKELIEKHKTFRLNTGIYFNYTIYWSSDKKKAVLKDLKTSFFDLKKNVFLVFLLLEYLKQLI